MARTRIAVLVAALLASGHQALANPTGPTVLNGTASFATSGSTLTVTNSPNAIINWQTFSIGAGQTTRFNQQSAISAVLNRVTTQNPSSILGTLQSNGRVFLINPNGIVFGSGSQVDVAGLVASSLDLSNSDFLAGRLRFTGTPGAGAVTNDGSITTTGANAPVYLIGPAVTNGGVITSPRGEVLLAAGNTVEIAEPGTPNLRVQITAPDNEARNLGELIADSGRINIFGGLIRHSGTTQANTAIATANGRIFLKATGDIDIVRSIHATAPDGEGGGAITVEGRNIRIEAADLVSGTQTIKAADDLTVSASILQAGSQSIGATNLLVESFGPDFASSISALASQPGTQLITIKNGGTLTVDGPAAGLFSRRQRIEFPEGGRLVVNGGFGLPENDGVPSREFTGLHATERQLIVGRPSIAIGLLSEVSSRGTQTIYASDMSLTEGANVLGRNQTIDVDGNLILNGFEGVALGPVPATKIASERQYSGPLLITGDAISNLPQVPERFRLTVAGDTTLTGGSIAGGAAIISSQDSAFNMAMGGDITLHGGTTRDAYALISSGGDINLTVGGVIQLNQGATPHAWARIQTESRRSTIGLKFPNLSSGGWLVNGVEGAIRRGQSGFFSGNGAAVLGRTLLVDYGEE